MPSVRLLPLLLLAASAGCAAPLAATTAEAPQSRIGDELEVTVHFTSPPATALARIAGVDGTLDASGRTRPSLLVEFPFGFPLEPRDATWAFPLDTREVESILREGPPGSGAWVRSFLPDGLPTSTLAFPFLRFIFEGEEAGATVAAWHDFGVRVVDRDGDRREIRYGVETVRAAGGREVREDALVLVDRADGSGFVGVETPDGDAPLVSWTRTRRGDAPVPWTPRVEDDEAPLARLATCGPDPPAGRDSFGFEAARAAAVAAPGARAFAAEGDVRLVRAHTNPGGAGVDVWEFDFGRSESSTLHRVVVQRATLPGVASPWIVTAESPAPAESTVAPSRWMPDVCVSAEAAWAAAAPHLGRDPGLVEYRRRDVGGEEERAPTATSAALDPRAAWWEFDASELEGPGAVRQHRVRVSATTGRLVDVGVISGTFDLR